MRSSLLFFFALLARKGSHAGNDFWPMIIPLHNWQTEDSASDQHRIVQIDKDIDEARVFKAPPAHYWEDALRHSVYLALVRDKIGQLLDMIANDSKSNHIDDHNLWEKIKAAPFDRRQAKDPLSFGDSTILAKGRLIEQQGEFRFIEDNITKENCSDDVCINGVKAFWSVKRVRQRDTDTLSGKYVYELTFSIDTHPKKQNKNPIRTFTVIESPPYQTLDMPQEKRVFNRMPLMTSSTSRPAKQVWVHRNIASSRPSNLDRIFSSLFSDDDNEYDPPKYRPKKRPTWQDHQYSQGGNTGAPTDQQTRITPYPYMPYTNLYARPIPPSLYSNLQAPSHYLKYSQPTKAIRPAVLPTPMSLVTASTRNWTEVNTVQPSNFTENGTNMHVKPYNKLTPIKMNYINYSRPPIYTAPPGVFVTMDKKPFKPMPLMKLTGKLNKYKPSDFRPSPQVLDMQHFSAPNAQPDTAFRPITWNYNDTFTTTTTERIEVAESTQGDTTRKTTPKGKKPPKKHENFRPTPTAPEIITASSASIEENEDFEWVHVTGAMSKTTPMETENTSETAETTTSTTTSTSSTTIPTSPTTTTVKRRTTSTTEAEEEEITTPKPKRRTRPPPKFVKPNKFKKNKRVNITKQISKPTQDLTPQASSSTALKPSAPQASSSAAFKPSTSQASSSAAFKPSAPQASSSAALKPSTPQTTLTSTTTTSTTTTRTTKATTEASNETITHSTATEQPATQPKTKNRFRQSTLMYKGTSVKHDKWSATQAAPTNTEKSKVRRKGSNFQGYASQTTPTPEILHSKLHEDYGSSTTLSVQQLVKPQGTDSFKVLRYQSDSEYDENDKEEKSDEEDQDDDLADEHMFRLISKPQSERTNEVDYNNIAKKINIISASSTEDDTPEITTENIFYSTPSTADISFLSTSESMPKTKCKKKQNEKLSTVSYTEHETPTTENNVPTESEDNVSTGFLEHIFNSFTKEDQPTEMPSDLKNEESKKHGQFVKLDDSISKLLDSLEGVNDEEYDYNVKPLTRDTIQSEYEDGLDDYSTDDYSTNEDKHSRDIDDNNPNSQEYNMPSLIELLGMD